MIAVWLKTIALRKMQMISNVYGWKTTPWFESNFGSAEKKKEFLIIKKNEIQNYTHWKLNTVTVSKRNNLKVEQKCLNASHWAKTIFWYTKEIFCFLFVFNLPHTYTNPRNMHTPACLDEQRQSQNSFFFEFKTIYAVLYICKK